MRIARTQRPREQHAVEHVIIGVFRASSDAIFDILHGFADADVIQLLGNVGFIRRERRFALQYAPRRLDRGDHADVARAAAVGVLQRDFDIMIVRVRLLIQECRRCHEQARRTEAALYRAVRDERLLQRMQMSVRQSLDGANVRAVRAKRRIDARIDGFAIDVNGTNATFRLVAADFRPSQLQVVAQNVRQRARFRHIERVCRPIDGNV